MTEIYKICTNCGNNKPLNCYYKHSGYKGGHMTKCKVCISKNNKKRYSLNKDAFIIKNSDYYNKNKDIIKKRHNKNVKKRYHSDNIYRLKMNLSRMFRKALLSKGFSKHSNIIKVIGCSFEELEKHLNDNPYNFILGQEEIDIDHIIPISKANTKEEIVKLNHWTNLQLLPSFYNRNIKRDNDFDKLDFEKWLKAEKV